MRHEHPLLKMLQAREGPTGQAYAIQMIRIFENYLAYDHLKEVYHGCSIAALSGDVARADATIKTAFGSAYEEILIEMARQQPGEPSDFLPALLLATSAVQTAFAVGATHQQKK